jgi:glutaredoxin 2
LNNSIQPFSAKNRHCERRSNQRQSKKGGNGNLPPHIPHGGDEMKDRVEAIEKTIPEIRERLIRVETKVDSIEQHMATKAELADFKTEINGRFADFKTEIKGEFAGFKTEIKGEFADFKSEIKDDLANAKLSTKSDLNELRVIMLQSNNNQIKWFIGALTALAGIVFAAIRLIQ